MVFDYDFITMYMNLVWEIQASACRKGWYKLRLPDIEFYLSSRWNACLYASTRVWFWGIAEVSLRHFWYQSLALLKWLVCLILNWDWWLNSVWLNNHFCWVMIKRRSKLLFWRWMYDCIRMERPRKVIERYAFTLSRFENNLSLPED